MDYTKPLWKNLRKKERSKLLKKIAPSLSWFASGVVIGALSEHSDQITDSFQAIPVTALILSSGSLINIIADHHSDKDSEEKDKSYLRTLKDHSIIAAGMYAGYSLKLYSRLF